MTKDIRQFCDVLLDAVERAGKQLSDVVREDLAGFDICCFTERFHLMPNIASVQRRSVSCDKNRTGWDAVFLCIRQQLFSEFPREKNRPDFPTGDHDLQELAVLLNVPDEKIVPVLSELSEIGFLTIEERDGIFQLNLW